MGVFQTIPDAGDHRPGAHDHMNRSRHWPWMMAGAVFVVFTAILTAIILYANQGVFTYALDDAYIHMAIAKNVARSGVWGVTPYEFSSSSSSLLWTLLLAGSYRLTGIHVWQPLALNLLAGLLLLAGVAWILAREGVRRWSRFATLMAVVVFMPLPTLSLTGQEHIFHTLIALIFLYYAAVRLEEGRRSGWKDWALWLGLAALLTMARYEGLFLAFAVGLLYVFKRRWVEGVAMGIAAWLPIGVYGLISMQHGWYFFPNSVLLKGRSLNLGSIRALIAAGLLFVQRLDATAYVLLLLIAIMALLALSYRRENDHEAPSSLWRKIRVMGLAYLLTALLHAQFAIIGPMTLYRYDAYLVAIGIVILALGTHVLKLRAPRPRGTAEMLMGLGLIVLLCLPLLERSGHALLNTPLAARNIFEQQYQMGRFAAMYYQGEGVAANDIGAINFYGDIRCFDLWGLGTLEVAQARRNHAYNTDTIDQMTRDFGVKIAMVYDVWFTKYGGLPRHWVKVGEWTQPENVLSGVKTISIYAVDPAEADTLIQRLQTFAPLLPPSVQQSGMYVK